MTLRRRNRDVWHERRSGCRSREGQEAAEEDGDEDIVPEREAFHEESCESNEENSNQKETCDIEGDREEITHEGDEIKTESSCEEGC